MVSLSPGIELGLQEAKMAKCHQTGARKGELDNTQDMTRSIDKERVLKVFYSAKHLYSLPRVVTQRGPD